MQIFKILMLTAAGCFMAGSLQADIFGWTDADGVKHFTNYAPPEDATILMKTEEVPYNEAADRARIEADRQYQLELARLEIAEREAELIRREAQAELRAAEAERRAAEAERYAAETERAADQYLEDAKNDRYYNRGGGYYGYYTPPHYKRWYYRKYRISHYYAKPYKHIYRKKNHYGPSTKKYGYRYYQKRSGYPGRYPKSHNLRSHNPRFPSGNRIGLRTRGQMGRAHGLRGAYGRR